MSTAAAPTGTNAGMPSATVRPSLLMSAVLLLTGQLLYIVVTQLHVGGEANDHRSIFAAYADSGSWEAVHLGQFAAMAVLLGGLIALPFALDSRPATTRWAALLGSAAATVSLALYAVLQAVDGIALKQAVSASATASGTADEARFAGAEVLRWLEWGVRSYHNVALGIALVIVAAVVLHAVPVPRAVAVLMAIAGLTHVAQGWLVGSDGFTAAASTAIVLGFAVNTAWMSWLLVVARRAATGAPAPALPATASPRVPAQPAGEASVTG